MVALGAQRREILYGSRAVHFRKGLWGLMSTHGARATHTLQELLTPRDLFAWVAGDEGPYYLLALCISQSGTPSPEITTESQSDPDRGNSIDGKKEASPRDRARWFGLRPRGDAEARCA